LIGASILIVMIKSARIDGCIFLIAEDCLTNNMFYIPTNQLANINILTQTPIGSNNPTMLTKIILFL